MSVISFICIIVLLISIGGAVAQQVERRTCDQQVMGSIPILGAKAA